VGTLCRLGETGRNNRSVCQKSNQLYVEGRLQTREWNDKETNAKRYTTEVVVQEFNLIGGKGQGSGDGHGEGDEFSAPSAPAKSHSRYNEAEEMEPEDIPF